MAYLLVYLGPSVASADLALDHYLRALNIGSTGNGFSTLHDTVTVATIAFALIAASWFLPSALQRDGTLGTPDQQAPSRRAAVLHRFTCAADLAAEVGYRTIATTARSWTHVLQRRWGPHFLPANPAFLG